MGVLKILIRLGFLARTGGLILMEIWLLTEQKMIRIYSMP